MPETEHDTYFEWKIDYAIIVDRSENEMKNKINGMKIGYL